MIRYFAKLPLFGFFGMWFSPKLAMWFSPADNSIICELEAVPKGKVSGTKHKSLISIEEARELRDAWAAVIDDFEDAVT